MKITQADRRFVWERSEKNGKVFCVHCGGEVHKDKPWDVCHLGIPNAHGGDLVGIGHRDCNRDDAVTFVIPYYWRTKRLKDRHTGITGPGLSDNPLPAGRRSNVMKKLNGKIEQRLSGSQKHARTMAMLYPNGRPE